MDNVIPLVTFLPSLATASAKMLKWKLELDLLWLIYLIEIEGVRCSDVAIIVKYKSCVNNWYSEFNHAANKKKRKLQKTSESQAICNFQSRCRKYIDELIFA